MGSKPHQGFANRKIHQPTSHRCPDRPRHGGRPRTCCPVWMTMFQSRSTPMICSYRTPAARRRASPRLASVAPALWHRVPPPHRKATGTSLRWKASSHAAGGTRQCRNLDASSKKWSGVCRDREAAQNSQPTAQAVVNSGSRASPKGEERLRHGLGTPADRRGRRRYQATRASSTVRFGCRRQRKYRGREDGARTLAHQRPAEYSGTAAPAPRPGSKINSGPGIQRDQIQFCPQAANQLHHLARMVGGVVDSVQQHVFECQLFTVAAGIPGRGHQLFPGSTCD